MDWSRFTPPPNFRETNPGEWHGPCPVTGQGTDACFLNVGAQQPPGCRKCSADNGRLTGAALAGHARAFGIWQEIDLGAATGRGQKVDTWVWTAPDGRTREQYRWESGDKAWQPTEPRNDPPPADLLFAPDGIPIDPVVYLLEGASDAVAAARLSLPVIGRTNAQPSPASLARLHRASLYRFGRTTTTIRPGIGRR